MKEDWKKIEKKDDIFSKVLITSFKGKNNTSSILLKQINCNNIDKLELTNSFITSENELKNKIRKNSYTYILCFGQKPDCNHIYIELYGNKNNNKIKTKYPYKKLISFFNENKIKYSLSKDAGNYLCNNIYYEGMKYIEDNSLDIKMLFIHIPSVYENSYFEIISCAISNYIEKLINNL